MKRILVTAVLLAISTAVFADPIKWRSPYTSAPALGGVSPLDAAKNARAMHQDLGAWHAGNHRWHLPTFRTAEAPHTR